MADATTQPIPMPLSPLPNNIGVGGLGGNTTAGQDISTIIGAILSGVGAFGGGTTGDVGKGLFAAQLADPYMNQRSQWWPQIQQQMTDIQGLMSDPTKFLQSPMFTAPLQLGGENLARQYGASGMGQSGNVGLAETQFGQSFADQYLQEQLGNMRSNLGALANLGGVNAGSPAAAAQSYLTGAGAQRTDLSSLAAGLGPILASILGGSGGLSGLTNWLKSIGGGSSATNDPYVTGGGSFTDPGSGITFGAPAAGGGDFYGGGGGAIDWSTLPNLGSPGDLGALDPFILLGG